MTDGVPDVDLQAVRREGLLAPSGAEPAQHDGTGRVSLSFTVIDPLAMPIGADTTTSLVTLDTMRRIRDEHGLNMTCGASNTSFGMPDRHTLGAAWLPMAMTAGLTSAIMDTRTPKIVEAVKAADVFLNHDEWGAAWIAAHRAKSAATA